jgi:hypothetical protein
MRNVSADRIYLVDNKEGVELQFIVNTAMIIEQMNFLKTDLKRLEILNIRRFQTIRSMSEINLAILVLVQLWRRLTLLWDIQSNTVISDVSCFEGRELKSLALYGWTPSLHVLICRCVVNEFNVGMCPSCIVFVLNILVICHASLLTPCSGLRSVETGTLIQITNL